MDALSIVLAKASLYIFTTRLRTHIYDILKLLKLIEILPNNLIEMNYKERKKKVELRKNRMGP